MEQGLLFCLRLKKNEFVIVENGEWQELNELGLKPGISLFLLDIKVTKGKQIGGFNLAVKWQRLIRGMAPKSGWFILTSLENLDLAIAAYRKRFDIEALFRDFKSGGYNLEDTNVSGNRLISLILIVAFACSSATFKGQKIQNQGVQKYVFKMRSRIPNC